ncbi:MAG: alpha/beta hydrolase [Bacteroidota bacterium]
MKILFIHGFVEDRSIFDEIRKIITFGEQIALNLNEVFADWQDAPEEMNVQVLAAYLIKEYRITSQDCVIGHSMGGWIASYMKEQIGCKAILVASLTNQDKLITPLKNLTLIKYFIRWGIMQSSSMINYLKKDYHLSASKSLYNKLVDDLAEMDKKYLYQQCQVLFTKVKPLTITPDIRIHARPDNIVKIPDEAFVEVLGDHFCLVYYPNEVAEAIVKVL